LSFLDVRFQASKRNCGRRLVAGFSRMPAGSNLPNTCRWRTGAGDLSSTFLRRSRLARASWAHGFDVVGNTPQGFREEVQEEITHWAIVNKTFNIKIE
jgi:hypothetical protein